MNPLDDKNFNDVVEWCMQSILDEMLKPENKDALALAIVEMISHDTTLPFYNYLRRNNLETLQAFEDACKATFARVFANRMLDASAKVQNDGGAA